MSKEQSRERQSRTQEPAPPEFTKKIVQQTGPGFKEEIIECRSNVQGLQTQIEDLHRMYTDYQRKYKAMKSELQQQIGQKDEMIGDLATRVQK